MTDTEPITRLNAALLLLSVASGLSVRVAPDPPTHAMRRARLKKNGDRYRSPPDGWESAIAGLARERAAELVKLAEELER